MNFKNHDLVETVDFAGVRSDQIPVKDPHGEPIEGL